MRGLVDWKRWLRWDLFFCTFRRLFGSFSASSKERFARDLLKKEGVWFLLCLLFIGGVYEGAVSIRERRRETEMSELHWPLFDSFSDMDLDKIIEAFYWIK